MGNDRVRSIGVLTTSRADYSYFRPILRGLHDSDVLDPALIVAGTHLSEAYGRTIREIEEDGYPIARQVPFDMKEDTPWGIGRTMGAALTSFVECFDDLKPDVLLILGDRHEVLAAAAAAAPFLIPLAHLHGGEVTEGALDENFRHSITKLSHLHFVSTDVYAQRVRQMGEEDWRVTVSGAPSLDNLRDMRLLDRKALSKKIGLDLGRDPALVTYHPATLDPNASELDEILLALQEWDGPVVFTAPNADAGNNEIKSKIAHFVADRAASVSVDNLGPLAYFSLLSIASMMVGNSSSGIIEAPTFALPVINVGDRQRGRVRAGNVLDVEADMIAIRTAFRRIEESGFRESLQGARNPYGDGTAAQKIVQRLETQELDERLIRKRFVDLGPSHAT